MMSRKIFKYQIPKLECEYGWITIEMPEDAEVISVQTQNGIGCIWAIVNEYNPGENKLFYVAGTGQELPLIEDLKFIGTFQQSNFAWHLFERTYATDNR